MRDLICFNSNTQAAFKGNNENLKAFYDLMTKAAYNVESKYTLKESSEMIREKFNEILGIDFKTASNTERRQAWRRNGKEVASLIENIIIDKMETESESSDNGITEFVEDVNLALGDKNEFYVEDKSLLTVSVFAGDHHDVVRQAVNPGKVFSVETSAYVIKVYTDFKLFMSGKIDFARLVEKMWQSVTANRKASLYTAFVSLKNALPVANVLSTPATQLTTYSIIDFIEEVATNSGKNVMLVGPKTAIARLQGASPDFYSDNAKGEINDYGTLSTWRGYPCLALSGVKSPATGQSVFANNERLVYVLPISDDTKPIKRVNEGDVEYYETGTDGKKKDMTVDGELTYWEGIAVVADFEYGAIVITDA